LFVVVFLLICTVIATVLVQRWMTPSLYWGMPERVRRREWDDEVPRFRQPDRYEYPPYTYFDPTPATSAAEAHSAMKRRYADATSRAEESAAEWMMEGERDSLFSEWLKTREGFDRDQSPRARSPRARSPRARSPRARSPRPRSPRASSPCKPELESAFALLNGEMGGIQPYGSTTGFSFLEEKHGGKK